MKLKILLLILCLIPFQRAGAQKPNLLFVFTDQQSYDMVGYYEGSQAITPHIDQLAKEGIAFNHCVSNLLNARPIATADCGAILSR